jgi:hypothetical protein
MKVKYSIILLFLLSNISFGGNKGIINSICLESIYQMEQQLAKKLDQYFPEHLIINTHKSIIGPMETGLSIIREIWIEGKVDKKYHFQKEIKAIIFPYIVKKDVKHWTNQITSLNLIIEIRDKEILKKWLDKNENVTIKFGIICEYNDLTKHIISELDSEKFKEILVKKLYKIEFLQKYKDLNSIFFVK